MPNGTLLLIDDETVLRQAVARTLELESYTAACSCCASTPPTF